MRLLPEGEWQQEAALDPDAGEWRAKHAAAAATAVLEDDIERNVWCEAHDHGIEQSREASEDSMVGMRCSHVHHANHLIDEAPCQGLRSVHDLHCRVRRGDVVEGARARSEVPDVYEVEASEYPCRSK